jgi:hypothetical protein
MQVSRLVDKLNEESKGNTESVTRKTLRDKIAALPQSQLERAKDVLVMIWNGVNGPLESPTTEPKLSFTVTSTLFPNWHRVKLALLKSIRTGTFIDVQFYAFNKIRDDLPLDPRPLFTSSIVIEEWGPAITTREWEVTSQLTRP